MNRSPILIALTAAMVVIGCLDFSPTVGPRPLNEQELAALRDSGPPVVTTDGGEVGARTVFFDRDIRPMMKRLATDPDAKGCYPCHDGRAAKHVGLDLGGLDLSTLGRLRNGGLTSGKDIVVPGQPEKSAIIQKLKGTYPYGTRMPKNGPPFWTPAEIELVEQWIREGAQGEANE
jgi:hypothetical protein